jgi:hypothetical protein
MKRVASLLLLIAGCVTVPLTGCARHTSTWKGTVEWPDEHSARLVAQPMEAGAAIAAAAAVREMVRRNPFPRLFEGCSSPEQGLDVAIFTGPTQGLYYVVLHQRFNRCGGPSGRVLDWWYEYAVTPQGEVVAEAPFPPGEAPVDDPLPSEQTPPPAAPSPSNAEPPPPASEAQPPQPGPEAPLPPAEVRP